MAVKLILTDIDGTILPYGHMRVSERTVAAIHAALDAGIVAGPASGRFRSWIPAFFGGDDACCATAIAANGMQVYHAGKMVLERTIDPDALRRAAAVLREVPGTGLIVFRDGSPHLVQGDREDLSVAFPRYARECLDAEGLPDAPVPKANIFVRGSLDDTRALVARLNREVDGLDFDEDVLRKAADLDAGARGGVFGEVLRVDLVDRREVVHVLDEDRRLDDVGGREPLAREYRGEVLKRLLGLAADASGDYRSRRGVERDLSRYEEESAGLDRLRVGAYRRRCVRRAYYFF